MGKSKGVGTEAMKWCHMPSNSSSEITGSTDADIELPQWGKVFKGSE